MISLTLMLIEHSDIKLGVSVLSQYLNKNEPQNYENNKFFQMLENERYELIKKERLLRGTIKSFLNN